MTIPSPQWAHRVSGGRAGLGALLLAAFVMILPGGAVRSQEAKMPTVSKPEIEAAAKRRVAFAHQSVGDNILDGVRILAGENGVKMNIVETREPPASGAGIFQFYVGGNGDPMGKIADFERTVGNASFPKVDVALVKLCYVDFNQNSDAVGIAKAYTEALQKLRTARPEIRFVAVTTPLTAIPSGPKAWMKRMMGKEPPDWIDNAKRKKFNEYIRANFDANHLFDIAKLEAETVKGPDGKEVEALRTELTSDGGHLNEKGKRALGAAFLKMVAAETVGQ